jgi:hypothetical protein
MKISKHVIERLEELTATKPEPEIIDQPLSEPGYVVKILAEEQGMIVSLVLQDYDKYSVALRYIDVSLEGSTLNEAETENYLNQRTEQLIQRLTYMEEPLALVELDADAGLAQVRSKPPQHDDEAVIYWEAQIRLKPQPGIRLARYRWTPGRPGRELVIYPIAFARLGQIVEDVALSLAQSAG